MKVIRIIMITVGIAIIVYSLACFIDIMCLYFSGQYEPDAINFLGWLLMAIGFSIYFFTTGRVFCGLVRAGYGVIVRWFKR